MNNKDPFALLLQSDDDDDDDDKNDKQQHDIKHLTINNDSNTIDLIIDDSFFDIDYTDNFRQILKFLKNDKYLTEKKKYKRFNLMIDLREKEIEILENGEPLYVIKYLLEFSKFYLTELIIDITAYNSRPVPFNNNDIPQPLDNPLLISIFNIITQCISKYKLNYLLIHWIPVNIDNYIQFTDGMISILNAKKSKENQGSLTLNILFTSQWVENLSNYHETELVEAIKNCENCDDLYLKFDKVTSWLPFNEIGLKSMELIFNAIRENVYIDKLSICADNFDSNGIDYDITNSLSECLENKKNLSSLKLLFDAQSNDDFLFKSDQDVCQILDALYENENICLKEFYLNRNGTKWSSKEIGLICDLIESDENKIELLVINGDFVSEYSFGMMKIVGFDKLVNCLIDNDQDDDDDEDEDILELKVLRVGTILDDESIDIYDEYVVKLIENCNSFLNEITIIYEKYQQVSFTQIIDSFFNHCFIIYQTINCIKKELNVIFKMKENDVIQLICDYSKLESFQIFIIDESDNQNNIDLTTERAEFRDCLYAFFDKIQFKFTKGNSEQNRKEFQKFAKCISIDEIGIYRSKYKTASSCVSVVL